MRVTIFIVYGGIHVVVHLDGKIERRKSSPYPEWPPGASLGRLAQAGGVENFKNDENPEIQKPMERAESISKTTFWTEKNSGFLFSGFFRPGPRGVHREGVPGGQPPLKKITI